MEYRYFLCLEYKKPKNYRKIYFSFGPTGLIYDTVYQYTLEQIDSFLANAAQNEIISQMKKDNILYFINDTEEERFLDLSIRHYEKEKERTIPILSKDCYIFSMEEFLNHDLTTEMRKKIYNKLGGYLVNSHIQENTKKWIRSFSNVETKEILSHFRLLPYEEQRKIKSIIYAILSKKDGKECEK